MTGVILGFLAIATLALVLVPRQTDTARRARHAALTAGIAVFVILPGGVAVAGARAAGSHERPAAWHAGSRVSWTSSTAVPARPCVLIVGKNKCASSNPRATIDFLNNNDTSACTFRIRIRWGDGSRAQVVRLKGGPAGPEFIADHLYKRRGVYHIALGARVVSGPCIASGAKYVFTLGPVSKVLQLAALGDSYSSGEGAGDYSGFIPDIRGCHRSPHAWALQLSKFVDGHDVQMSDKKMIACSGATSPDLTDTVFKGQKPQFTVLKGLSPRPTLVTLTMGGNDVGFASILTDCYEHDCVSDGTVSSAAKTIAAEAKTLVADYQGLRAADKVATVLIVGYPRIFEQDHWCGGIKNSRQSIGFSPRELKALNQLGDKLDSVISQSAAKAKVSYVNITGALAGHELCTKQPWVYSVGLETAWTQQAGHPTRPGQTAIAKVIARYLNNKL